MPLRLGDLLERDVIAFKFGGNLREIPAPHRYLHPELSDNAMRPAQSDTERYRPSPVR
ncbi:hypothetical protein [Rhodomicrobium vannielii]|uniref:hypothetical protein n=1 Tax=Rhodomicrobium vannielii TaxID=1069 RepID=UPI001594F606|nr:hypothetical protein [Rhodomicrobium vannielii]